MYRLAVEALKPGGTMALFTGGGGSLPQGRKAVAIIEGDAVPQQFIPKLIDLYLAGHFPFDRLVTFYDFGDVNRAMADSRKGKAVKPVLRISDP